MSDEPMKVCLLWREHDFMEQYYGHQCKNCDLFIPYGSEPWVCEAGEHIEIDRFGERGPR